MAKKEEINNRNFIASMKRIARNVAPKVKERERLVKEIEAKQARIAELNEDIAGEETSIRRKTGYGVMDLIKREVVDTGKVDKKTGKPIKDTQFNLRYPETILPPENELILENEENKEVAPVESELPFMTEDVMNPSSEI